MCALPHAKSDYIPLFLNAANALHYYFAQVRSSDRHDCTTTSGKRFVRFVRSYMEDLACAVFKITMPKALYALLTDKSLIKAVDSPQEMDIPDFKAFGKIGCSTHKFVKITCFQGTLGQHMDEEPIPLRPGQTSFITLEEQEKLANEKEDTKKREKPGRAKEQDAKRARQEAEEKKNETKEKESTQSECDPTFFYVSSSRRQFDIVAKDKYFHPRDFEVRVQVEEDGLRLFKSPLEAMVHSRSMYGRAKNPLTKSISDPDATVRGTKSCRLSEGRQAMRFFSEHGHVPDEWYVFKLGIPAGRMVEMIDKKLLHRGGDIPGTYYLAPKGLHWHEDEDIDVSCHIRRFIVNLSLDQEREDGIVAGEPLTEIDESTSSWSPAVDR